MKIHFGRLFFGGLISALITTAPLGATSVGAGSFNLQGTIEVTTSQLVFGYNVTPPPPPGDQLAHIQPPLTGVFASGPLALSTATPANIKDISAQPHFPDGALSVPQWVVLPDTVMLDLLIVPFSTDVPNCTGSDPTKNGFSCRPMVNGQQSPIILTQTQTGVDATVNFKGIAYTGTSASGSSAFSAILDADFSNNDPQCSSGGTCTIDALLATFATQKDSAGNNYIATGYTGNFSTAVVPEPGLLALVGLGVF